MAGDDESALVYYAKVVDSAPLSTAAYISHQKRAEIFLSQRRPKGAVEEYMILIRRFPKSENKEEFEIALVEAELASNQIESAYAMAKSLTKSKNPEIAERAMFVRAEALFLSHKWSESIRAYKRFLKKFKKSPAATEAVCHMVSAYESKGELGSARAQLKKWEKVYPNDKTLNLCKKALLGLIDVMSDEGRGKKK